MKAHMNRCMLCGRDTSQRCAYCHEPICDRCHVTRFTKSYCSPRHRDSDHGLGNVMRKIERSVRQYLY